MKHKLAPLEACSLFKHKSLKDIEFLLSKINYRIVTLEESTIIFSPLQNADTMGIILKGTVDVQKLFPNGKVVMIERKKSADVIAESSIFTMLDYYSDTFVASKSCEVILLAKKDLLTLFELDHTIQINFMECISNSSLILKNKIGILSLDSIREKIAGYLIYNYKMNTSCIITLPFSKKEWAEYLDVSRTSLSRELRGLEQDGILSFHKRSIEIKDMHQLEQILSL